MRPFPVKPLPNQPLISVLIANYNYASYIGRAIESVLRQTYQNFEIIVCDDGSNDDSLEVINSYAARDERVFVIAKRNGGQASALNAAFLRAKGDIIAILDADDTWYANRLEMVRNTFLADHRVGFVYHRLKVVDAEGRLMRLFPKPNVMVSGWVLCKLNREWLVPKSPASSISLHRSIAEQVFPLPEEFRAIADTVITWRSSVIAFCQPIYEPLGIWQQHRNNTTGYINVGSLDAIEKQIPLLRNALIDMIGFIKEYYPSFEVNQVFFERESLGWITCIHALYSGRKMTLDELRLYRTGFRIWFWYFLLRTPRFIGLNLYQSWLRNIRMHSLFSRF